MRTLSCGRWVGATRRGFASSITLLFLLSVVMLGMTLLGQEASTRRLTSRRIRTMQALNLAISGVDETIASLKANPGFMASGSSYGYTVPGSSGGTVTCSYTEVNGVGVVVSTGTVDAGSLGTLSRKVRAVLPWAKGWVPTYQYAISSKDDMDISGGTSTTDDSGKQAGDVYSNGNLTISGSSTRVIGSASAVGTVNVSSATITGEIRNGAAPLTFPDVDQTFMNKALVDGTTTGNTTVSGGAGTLLKGKYVGNLTVSGSGCTIADDSVVWVTGDLDVSGLIRGRGTLVVEGKITANGGAAFSGMNVLFITTYPRTASNPTATTNNMGITLTGGSTANGFFYAPYSGLKVAGGTSVLGGVSAKTVQLSGGPVITVPYGRTLPPAPGSNGKRQAWQEQ